jgi:hypothetical protein
MTLDFGVNYNINGSSWTSPYAVTINDFGNADQDATTGKYHELYGNVSGLPAAPTNVTTALGVTGDYVQTWSEAMYADRYTPGASNGTFGVPSGDRLFGIGSVASLNPDTSINTSLSLFGPQAGFTASRSNLFSFVSRSVGVSNAFSGTVSEGNINVNKDNWLWSPLYNISATLESITMTSDQTGSGTQANPFMPTTQSTTEQNSSTGTVYTFNDLSASVGNLIYIDPVVATGYSYSIDDGGLVSQIDLPDLAGANYSINELGTWISADVYEFANPVNSFSVTGIPVSAGLDPSNQSAFNTGLVFADSGNYDVTMTPITFNTDSNPATATPEPGTMLLMGVGALGTAYMRRRAKKA